MGGRTGEGINMAEWRLREHHRRRLGFHLMNWVVNGQRPTKVAVKISRSFFNWTYTFFRAASESSGLRWGGILHRNGPRQIRMASWMGVLRLNAVFEHRAS